MKRGAVGWTGTPGGDAATGVRDLPRPSRVPRPFSAAATELPAYFVSLLIPSLTGGHSSAQRGAQCSGDRGTDSPPPCGPHSPMGRGWA